MFSYINSAQKSMLALWCLRQGCFPYYLVISGAAAELKNPRNRLEHPLVWYRGQTDGCCLGRCTLEIDAAD